MSAAERVYAALLVLLPRRFRTEAEAEMRAVFRDGLQRVRAVGGLRARARFWTLTLFDLLLTTFHSRLGRDVRRPGPRPTFPDEGHPMFASLIKDLRFAIRTLAGSPGFTATVVLTLALGIGANTAIFSVVDGVMLRPLPLPEPDRLVAIWSDWTANDGPVREWMGFPEYLDARELTEHFADVGTWLGWGPTITGAGDRPEMLNGARISHGMFAGTLRVDPALGRNIGPADDLPDAEPVVLLSHAFWTRKFGADPGALGETVQLDGNPYVVIGVMPEGFRPPFAPQADLWTPLRMDSSQFAGSRGSAMYRTIGRLQPGIELETARAALRAVATRTAAEFPQSNSGKSFSVFPLRDDIVSVAATAMWMLLGAVGFVLLMACVNVANLVLAQSTSRTDEFAVRAALGAGRGRILRQLLTEAAVLSVAGGVLGAAIGAAGTRFLVSLAPAGTPRIEEVALDARVLGFTAAVSLASVLVFGLVPALRVARRDLHDALKEGGRGRDQGSSGRSLRSALVVVQVALALVLLIGAGLLVRTFDRLNSVDLGFEPEGVLTVNLNLPGARYPDGPARIEFYAELERRLAALPGVQQVGLNSSMPLSGGYGDATFFVEAAPIPEPGRVPAAWIQRVTPGYFDTMGVEIVAGRGFTTSDGPDDERVIVINETMAREWLDGDPVGRRVTFGNPTDPDTVWRRIVGVAQDSKHFGVGQGPRYVTYFPYDQVPSGFMSAALRSQGDPESLVPSVRDVVADLDPELATAGFATLTDVVDDSLGPERFVTLLMSAFAGVALVLAVVGLYGVVSYGVGLRMHEMGVRVALGAGGREIGRLVVGGSALLIGLGLVAGLGGALAVTRLMGDLLYGISPTDPATYAGVVAVLAAVGLVASVLPARRAARVDPVSVLNRE